MIYIFADSLTLHLSDCTHSRALQYRASIMQELDSMPPDDFRAELRDSLTSLYEGVLKVSCAGRRPQPKIFKQIFTTKLYSPSFRIRHWV
jgi:hypothetical protein